MDVFVKQPREVLDYDVSLENWFLSSPEDDIESVELVISSYAEETPSLEVGPGIHPEYVLLGNNPKVFKVWLGGGTHQVDYIVTCIVHTEQDRTTEVEFKIKVRNK